MVRLSYLGPLQVCGFISVRGNPGTAEAVEPVANGLRQVCKASFGMTKKSWPSTGVLQYQQLAGDSSRRHGQVSHPHPHGQICIKKSTCRKDATGRFQAISIFRWDSIPYRQILVLPVKADLLLLSNKPASPKHQAFCNKESEWELQWKQ